MGNIIGCIGICPLVMTDLAMGRCGLLWPVLLTCHNHETIMKGSWDTIKKGRQNQTSIDRENCPLPWLSGGKAMLSLFFSIQMHDCVWKILGFGARNDILCEYSCPQERHLKKKQTHVLEHFRTTCQVGGNSPLRGTPLSQMCGPCTPCTPWTSVDPVMPANV